MKLDELILECAKNGITGDFSYNKDKERIEYTIRIGSKTGTGCLYEETNNNSIISLTTRYQQHDIIGCFRDIVFVAYDWFKRYPEHYPDDVWLRLFDIYGFKL